MHAFIEDVLLIKDDACVFWPFGTSVGSDGIKRREIVVEGKRFPVARYVCTLAHGCPPDDGVYQAAHSCGNGHEVCVNPNHLRWATPKENQHDRVMHGTSNRGVLNYRAKLTPEDVGLIKRLHHKVYQKDLATVFGVSASTIQDIHYGVRWKTLDSATKNG